MNGSTPKPATVASLLPEHPTPDANGQVQVGHLKVEAGLYDQFRSAMVYADKNPDTAGMVKRLVDGPHDTDVKRINDNDAWTQPHANGDATVAWNPKNMFVDGQGGKHSASAILGHELDHADQYTHNPAQYLADRRTPAGAYNNKEEQRVIEGWERKTSRDLGEGVRTDHNSGTFVPNRDVRSTEPVLHQTRGGHTSEVTPGYSQSGTIKSITADTVTQDIGHGQTVSYPRNELTAVTLPSTLKVGDNLNVTMSGHDVHAVVQAPQQHQQQPQQQPGVGQTR